MTPDTSAVEASGDRHVLVVGPLRIPLRRIPEGPQLAPTEPALEAMAWVLNAAVREDGAAIFDAMVNGRDWVGNDLAVEQVGPGHDISAGRAAWREITGADPQPPLTVLATGFLPSGSVVPRAVAADAALELRRRRHAEATEPPWIFRREPPVWPVPHASERPRIDDLNGRARDLHERAERLAGADEPADLLADRSALLLELDAAGHPRPLRRRRGSAERCPSVRVDIVG
jgi:hypothetical protein